MSVDLVQVEVLSCNIVDCVYLLIIRSTLIDDTENLRVDQLTMQTELSTLQLRWNSVREEKIKVANILSNIKRAEEELDRLAEEKSQVELALKVIHFVIHADI